MKQKTFAALLMFMSICTLQLKSFAQTNDQIANDIMAIVKAQWTAANSKAPIAEQMKNISDDYTEFNNDYATRVDGKALNQRISEANMQDASQTITSEMLNPKVQVYGDVAILSYNYAGIVKDAKGDLKPVRAKSTRVYVKQNGKWMMVHANFGFDPVPAN